MEQRCGVEQETEQGQEVGDRMVREEEAGQGEEMGVDGEEMMVHRILHCPISRAVVGFGYCAQQQTTRNSEEYPPGLESRQGRPTWGKWLEMWSWKMRE